MKIDMESYWKAFVDPLDATLHRVVAFVPRLLVAIALFLLFYALATLTRQAVRRSLERVARIPGTVRILIARCLYLLLLLLGLIVALSAANVNVTAILTSLGVAGFALGFALKDVLENFIAGILLLFARPFEVGDQVTLGNYEGTVTDIQLRTTALRTYDEEIVAIPNSQVFTNAVINHTRLGKRRYRVAFDTSVSADADHVERETLRGVTENPDIASDPAPFIRMESVDSGNDILKWQVFYWAAPTKAVEVATVSQTLQHIKRALYDTGVPTPTATSATILKRKPPEAE